MHPDLDLHIRSDAPQELCDLSRTTTDSERVYLVFLVLIAVFCPVVSGTGSNLSTDIANTYSFDCNTGLFINGVASGSVTQLTQLITVWDLMRVHKVEFTFIPQFNSLDIVGNEAAVSNYSIPILYLAEDYSDDAAIGSLAEIQAYGNVKMYRFDKPVKHTLYPRLDGSNGVVDIGANRVDQFMKAGTTSTQNFKGLKTYIDIGTGMDNCSYKCLVKIYYECAGSR